MEYQKIVDQMRRETASNVFYSGEDDVCYGRVLRFSDKLDKSSRVAVTGDVEGSYSYGYYSYNSGTHYRATCTLDLEQGKVLAHTCNCLKPLNRSQRRASKDKRWCRHQVAIVYTYLRAAECPGMPEPEPSRREPECLGSETLPIDTSPKLSKLITAYSERSASSALDEVEIIEHDMYATVDPVEIYCQVKRQLPLGEDSAAERWEITLKVGRPGATYVVKNIKDLLDARDKGTMVRYGKKLEFAHRRSAFSKTANDVLDLIARFAEDRRNSPKSYFSNGSGYGSYNTYGYNYSYSYYGPKREMLLKPAECAELIEALGDHPFLFAKNVRDETRPSGWTAEVQEVVCEDGTPDLIAHVEKGVRGSFDFTIEPGYLDCLFSGERAYILGHGVCLRCPEDFSADVGALCASLLPMSEPLHIRDRDMATFCSVVMPVLRKYMRVEEDTEVEVYTPPEAKLSFQIGYDHGYIYCDARVTYADTTLDLFEQAYKGQPSRDVTAEIRAQRMVQTFFPYDVPDTPDYAHPDEPVTRPTSEPTWYKNAAGVLEPPYPWFLREDDEAYYLLFSEGLAKLAELGTVDLAKRLKGVTVREAPSIRIDAGVSSGLLDIDVTSTEMTPEELIAYLSSFRRHQRFVRLKSGDLVAVGESAEAVMSLAEGLGMAPQDLVEGVHGISANRTLFVDAILKRAGGVRFERNRAFRRIVRDFDTIADADFTAPDAMVDVLRPYQDEGFKWLATLGGLGFGGILADDMGLGKTLELLTYLTYRKQEGEGRPALVVCPASLVYNWRAEAERFSPDLDVCCLTGTKAERREILKGADDHDLIVTSYDLLRRDVEELSEPKFSCVALDEAQYVKNNQTKVAKAARALNADVRFALTGTPIENRLQELWSIFDFLMPGMLGTLDSFSRRFANPISNGEEAVAERLRSLVSPFILRRNKRDVLKDLPDKNETVIIASMEGEQDKLYRANAERLALSIQNQLPEEFAVSRIKILAELTKLRQICCDPHLVYENYHAGSAKLDTCMELVHQAVDGGHQLLLFSQFTSMLELIEARLKKEKVSWIKLTGATSKEERVRLVERFQAGEVPVFLISLKAGGTGLNLTAADVVIHYDPWWNLAAQNQATDRTHRIGQTREVSVFKIIAKGTIEEKIVAMQEKKRDLAESVIGGEASSSTAISREDLLALLDAAQ